MTKRYWWITCNYCGHFKTIHVNYKDIPEDEIDNQYWNECIYFDTEEAALEFSEKLKEFISDNYDRASSNAWYK